MTLALLRSGVRVAVAELPASAAEMRELRELAGKESLESRLLPIECDVTHWPDCLGAVKKAADHFGAVTASSTMPGLACSTSATSSLASESTFLKLTRTPGALPSTSMS